MVKDKEVVKPLVELITYDPAGYEPVLAMGTRTIEWSEAEAMSKDQLLEIFKQYYGPKKIELYANTMLWWAQLAAANTLHRADTIQFDIG